MSLVRVEKTDTGFVIKPTVFGISFGAFKKKVDADLAATALNKAYEMGQERTKADFRALIGASAEVE